MRGTKLGLKATCCALLFIFLCGALGIGKTAVAWSNGGNSSDPNNPDYGTHDWIAEHAMNFLPVSESGWLSSNKIAFLYGTEAPDNSGASFQGRQGYGDQSTKHHNYYSGTTITDSSASTRAGEEYQKALDCLKNGSNALAAWFAGAMTHYIDDMAAYGHVMSGEAYHSEYEEDVNTVSNSYSESTFPVSSDGTLETISAFDAAKSLGLNTYNDGGSTYTAQWMSDNFQGSWVNVGDWSPEYKARAGESINLAVNIVAAVLHTLTAEAGAEGATGGTTSSPISTELLIGISAAVLVAMVVAIFARPKKRR